jgi:glycosyltransferase involved in cell wall biosynthesis
MFEHIAGPYNQMMGIAHAHMQHVVRRLREGGVDVVHDHLEVVGASTLAAMAPAVPPVLHTLHWDLRKHPDFYGRFDGAGRVWCNGVSDSQVARAPEALRRHALGAVPLAVDPAAIPFQAEKGSRFLVLARITEVKGQDLAAQACREGGWALDIAGPVAGAPDPAALDAGLADPGSTCTATPTCASTWTASARSRAARSPGSARSPGPRSSRCSAARGRS